MQPVRAGASLLLVAGVALLALAIGLLAYAKLDGSRSPSSFQPSSLDPYLATNGTVAFWEQRVHRDPMDFVAYNHLAQGYIQRGRETGDVADYTRAQAAVDASLKSLPRDNPGAIGLTASLQLVRHDFAAALATAYQAINGDPGDPYGYAVLGDAQLALGEYDEAYSTYQKLVRDFPGLSSFARLAHIQELQGRADEAQLDWKNAIASDGGHRAENTAWTHVQFGNFYFSRGDLESAESEYNNALSALPGYVHALAGLAKAAAARGDYDEAIQRYSAVTGRQPLPEYVAAFGDVYAADGQQAEAQKQYNLVLAINQLYKANGINTDLAMSVFLADHDLQIDEALRQANDLYSAQPDSIYAADALAWALYKAGRAGEAAPYAERALRLGTPDPSLLYHAGMIAKQLGQTGEARFRLAEALQINPQFSVLQAPRAREALATPEGMSR